MAFRLKDGEPVSKGVKRLAAKELDKAIEVLSARGKGDRDETVHDARKRLKKVRALLRLVRDEVGESVYKAENAALRDAAHPLTEVRDAKVLVDALDGVIEHAAEGVNGHAFDSLRRALGANQREVRKRVLEVRGAFTKVKAALREARRRVKDWPVAKRGWGALEGGLRRVYRAARNAFATAAAAATVENLHEWRKQVKYLWHQLEVLEPVWPGMMDVLAEQARVLSGYLGDDHDLAILRQTLEGDPQKFRDRNAVEKLLPLLDRRRAELQRQAAALGQRLHRDRPGEFVRRVKAYWKAWRAEAGKAERV